MTRPLSLLFVLPLALLSIGDDETDPPPYPRDVTLETLKDAKALAALQAPGKVLFEDGFESDASLDRFFDIHGRDDGRTSVAIDEELAHGGKGVLKLSTPAREEGSAAAGVSAWLGKEGHDCVYFRRYIRFPQDYDQGHLHHVGGGLAGVASDGKWDEMGQAGVRPTGDDRFSAGFEPWREWGRTDSPGYLFLYTYWMDMKQGGDGNWYGNMLEPPKERRIVPKRDEWVCLEQMIQVNDVGEANGEMAAWVDGKLYLHWKGFRWRTTERLRIKRFNLGLYLHEARKANTVYYDDVVVSTGYVGPVRESEK